jgi:hypothetical protein
MAIATAATASPASNSPINRRGAEGIFRRGFLADRQLHAVLLVWFLCWSAYGLLLFRYCLPLPWADEWELTGVATGKEPLTLEWLWTPENEHRAPLTRLEVLLVGKLTGWDLRFIHHFNLDLLALGSLLLILAVRRVRGYSTLADAFLPLLILTPWQFQSILVYGYAYAMALALVCVALSALITGWPLRSAARLALYFLCVLGITFAGGPAGNLWAVGLCAITVRGWLERRPLSWKTVALVGTGLVVASSCLMLMLIPEVAKHDKFLSDSLETTIEATGKLLVVWLGVPLSLWWPWALAAVAVPTGYIVMRTAMAIWRWAGQTESFISAGAWLELTFIVAAAVAVAVMIGHGRGLYPNLWEPRYCTLLIPVPLALYLFLLRVRSSPTIPAALAFGMAVAVGWNWPAVISISHEWHDRGLDVVRLLRQGREPLSAIAQEHAQQVGYDCDADRLLGFLVQLRETRQSVFQEKSAQEPVPGLGQSRLWEAEDGRFNDGLSLVEDWKASKRQALQATAMAPPWGTVVYNIEVPGDGTYELFCRLAVPTLNAFLTVRVDDGPMLKRLLPQSRGYYTYRQEPIVLHLKAGPHVVSITLGRAGTKLDLVELLPRKSDAIEKADAARDREAVAEESERSSSRHP